MIDVLVDIGDIALLNISIDKVHPLEVKYVEGLPSDHADISVFVEPLGCVPTLIAAAHLDHFLRRLLQEKLLVVKESIRCFKTGKLALLVPKTLDFEQTGTDLHASL